MEPSHAKRIVEALRKGIPPDGYVRHFTVGRQCELRQLTERLQNPSSGSVLLKANYGSGKTHLLRYIREHALGQGYAVSTVTLDAKAGIRFNRMDQILGAICRGLEVPVFPGRSGIRPYFDFVMGQVNESEDVEFWNELSNGRKWNYSSALESPAMFVAFRAWFSKRPAVQDLIEDWLRQPSDYRTQRKQLYHALVANLNMLFKDPRDEWKFYADEVFWFHTQAYAQSWAAIRDLDRLARASGLKGVIVLFDEFEDILTNISNRQHQNAAFWNLFHFFSGKLFPGMTFYAVTPEFTEKCKLLLRRQAQWDYNFYHFEELPTFQMSPLKLSELLELAQRIIDVHGIAYDWDVGAAIESRPLGGVVQQAAAVQIEDRARHTITAIVRTLDDLREETE